MPVVNSASLWKHSPTDCCLESGFDTPEWGIGPYPPEDVEITIVFWTGDPEARWIPPCTHFNDVSEPGQTPDSVTRTCTAVELIWDSLIKIVHDARQRLASHPSDITLVNVEAIISLATSDRPAMSIVEEYFRSRSPRHFDESSDRYTPLYFFTMQEWIQEGYADDVFSPEELAPFGSRGG